MKTPARHPAITVDVSDLPTYGFSHQTPIWWGMMAFVAIEGLGFVFSIVAYIYLQTQNQTWPMNPPPGLFWSGLLTFLLIVSEAPNWWTKRAAQKHDVNRVRIGLVIMSLVGLAALGIRVFEFTTLGVKWDDNAYGSIVWLLIGLHTAHLVTDVVETWVITVLLFIGPVDMRRFSDVDDNQAYWDFVVLAWLAVYAVVYWLPRFVVSG